MIDIIPNWHPVFVHYTVALLSIATILYLVSMFTVSEHLRTQWQNAARWNLWIGAGFTVLTVIFGIQAYNSVAHDTPSHTAMTDHRNWALVTSVVFLLITAWSMVRARAGKHANAAMVIALLIASGLLASTAWRGGEVVYRYGLGVMSLPQTDDHGHAPGVADDHHTDTPSTNDSHGHDEGVGDDHHNEPENRPQQSDDQEPIDVNAETHSHDVPSAEKGEVHTHADGTVERH